MAKQVDEAFTLASMYDEMPSLEKYFDKNLTGNERVWNRIGKYYEDLW